MFFFFVHMVCSDADPIKELLLPVQSQVESSLQTCRFLNGKVKQHRDGDWGMQYTSASLKSRQGAGHKSHVQRQKAGSMQKQPMEMISQQLRWETCPTIPHSQRNTTAFTSHNLCILNSEAVLMGTRWTTTQIYSPWSHVQKQSHQNQWLLDALRLVRMTSAQ